ncbi:MAG: DUF3299 domain-containing protein, partial [Planctomycetota bacterium]|nr:DUF3299 domain-containing protein [Planctomycetota bacterium]
SGESVAKAEPAGTGSLPESENDPAGTTSTSAESKSAVQATGVAGQVTTVAVGGQVAEKDRQFRAEGPHGALRITYDDLDLLKLLQMDPVTPDCVEKMPAWLRALDGKPVRLRGFMKPDVLNEGIRRFLFVKDTGLCCFGPAGKIYDLIEVTLKKGTSTKYIELKPFDVVGTFKIHVEYLDDVKEVYELFHIDDAEIIQK